MTLGVAPVHSPEKAPASENCPGQLKGMSETKETPVLYKDTLGRNAECPGSREEPAREADAEATVGAHRLVTR